MNSNHLGKEEQDAFLSELMAPVREIWMSERIQRYVCKVQPLQPRVDSGRMDVVLSLESVG